MLLALVVFVILTITSFAYSNGGARGLATCRSDALTGPGALSWWPPGASCEGGEPTFTEVRLNATFLVVPALVLLLGVAVWTVQLMRHGPTASR